jgi:integrase
MKANLKMKKRSHGDGSIDARGANTFRLRYRVGKQRFAVTFRGSLADARKELRRLLRAGDTGEHVAPNKLTFGQWARQWIEAGAPGRKRRKVGARAIERYDELLRVHVLPVLGERTLQTINATEIDKLYCGLEDKISDRTARHVHSVLGACLGAAVRTKQIVVSPMDAVSAVPCPGEADHGVALDEDELTRLVQGFMPTSLFEIVATLAFTGCRRNEALALRWSDLDPGAKMLTIARAVEETNEHGLRFKGPKNERSKRTIQIDDDLLAVLLALRDKYARIVAGVSADAVVDLSLVRLPDDALMFPSPGTFTRPRHPRGVTKEFSRRAKKLGFERVRLHDLRGTHETLLLDKGVPVHIVAARCGHDPAVLLRAYAKRTKKADASAAQVIGGLSKAILGRL